MSAVPLLVAALLDPNAVPAKISDRMRDKMHDNIRVSERTSEYACQQICPIECWNIWITCQLECQNICQVESQAKCQINVSRMSVGGDHSKKVIPLVKPNILIHFDRDLMGFSGV